jgi:4-diphosphocytidyl-2-C-methyl-D-erythritol kinase
VFQTISLQDQLIMIRRDDDRITLSCNDRSVPLDEENLVFRAALALRHRGQSRAGVDIALLKRIPVKAGLGGASSNAAMALMGLNILWETRLGAAELQELGAQLGSDVPYFFVGGLAVGTGTGTDVSPLPETRKQKLIVITPQAAIATANAYKALNAPSLTSSRCPSILTSSFAEPVLDNCEQWPPHNDFEAVIFEIEPECERAKKALLQAGARSALLTGSGSSVFGFFDDEESRQHALINLTIEPGWRVFSCSTISRGEYLAAMGSVGLPLS